MYLRSSCCNYPHSIIPIPSWWHTRETTLVTVCTCTRSPSTHTQLYPFHPTWTTVRTCTRSPSTHTQLRHTCETTWMTVYTCTRSLSSSPFHTMSAAKCNYWTSFTVSGTRAGNKDLFLKMFPETREWCCWRECTISSKLVGRMTLPCT